MRQLIVIILDNIIELEKKFIDEKKLENEEELKKYNKEKEEWEKTCNDYEEIKNNFEIYINEIKDYLSENIDPGISGMTANKELNNIKQEYNPLNEKVIITSEKNIINRPKYEQPINNPSLISNDLTASTHTRAFNGKNIIQQGNENKNNLRIAKESYQNQNINNYSKNNNIIVTTQTANNQQKNVMNNNQNNSRIDYHAQKAYVQPKNDEELKTKKDTPPKNVSESEYNYQAGNQDTGKTGIRKRYVRYGYRRIGKDPDNNA